MGSPNVPGTDLSSVAVIKMFCDFPFPLFTFNYHPAGEEICSRTCIFFRLRWKKERRIFHKIHEKLQFSFSFGTLNAQNPIQRTTVFGCISILYGKTGRRCIINQLTCCRINQCQIDGCGLCLKKQGEEKHHKLKLFCVCVRRIYRNSYVMKTCFFFEIFQEKERILCFDLCCIMTQKFDFRYPSPPSSFSFR